MDKIEKGSKEEEKKGNKIIKNWTNHFKPSINVSGGREFK